MELKIEIDLSKIFALLRNVLSKVGIEHLLLLSLMLHLFVMSFPSDGGMIFDEAYYVPAALKSLQLQAANAEQMPLAKIVVGVSIGIFGNYWFAWRFPIVVMGVVSLYVFYRIALRFLNKKQALFATAFLSFDIIYFVHGTIFVLDMPAVLFGLMGVDFYLSKKYKWSALSLAISFLMKISGFMFFMIIAIFHVATKLRRSNLKKNNFAKIIVAMLIFAVVSGVGLWLYDYVYKPANGTSLIMVINNHVVVDANQTPITTQTLSSYITSANIIANPYEHMMFQLTYFEGLVPSVNTPSSEYRPSWSWIVPFPGIDPIDSPVYYGVAVTVNGVTENTIKWVSQNSLPVAYMFIPILCVAVVSLLKRKTKDSFAVLFVSWVLSTYGPWLYIGIIQRMTFNYYFIYTIPALCLGIPYFWGKMPLKEEYRNYVMFIHLTLTIIFFFCFFPIAIFR
jgi:4-amino-4-deoxy-L-arabinose transferase-like glycosyltransferase